MIGTSCPDCRAPVPVAVKGNSPSTATGTVALQSGARTLHAFTLIEVLLASVAAAMVLVIVYSVFTSVIHLRDNATARVRQTRLRTRAAAVLRRDLQGALISGGTLANTLEGDSNKQSSLGNSGSAGPGYLRMTTTTGKDSGSNLYGDVQEVEYHLTHNVGNTSSDPSRGNALVRTITRDLLAANTLNTPQEETLLTDVASMQVAFYDGTTWQESWEAIPTTYGTSQGSQTGGTSGASSTAPVLPQAIRIDIRQTAPTKKDSVPPLLEILVPWTTQPFATPTPTPQ